MTTAHFLWARLLFAALVIFSHSPELLGMPEPLRALGLPFSLGDLAVDGFFIVSGYLVSLSWEREPGPAYARKRVLRIVPGFMVCAAICGGIIAPLTGATGYDWLRIAFRILTLREPEVTGAFPLQHFHNLDGSLWTISWEAGCYGLAALLGWWGYFKDRTLFLGLMGIALVMWIAYPMQATRLATIFMLGILWRIWAPLKEARGNSVDISYGLYLYAWPIGQLLIFWGVRSLWALDAATLALASVAGAVSWFLVEKPCLGLWRRREARVSGDVAVRVAPSA